VPGDANPDLLIVQARGGDEAALRALLDLYRNYLRLVARSLMGMALRIKLEPSDPIQETLLKVHRDFAGFLRTLEHVPFDQIARKMGRSVGAVRMLWARALEKLNRSLENSSDFASAAAGNYDRVHSELWPPPAGSPRLRDCDRYDRHRRYTRYCRCL